MAEIPPPIFFGHGNPMNAVLNNSYTEGWRRIGQQIPRPKAILSISAHWFVPETAVTISAAPRTIHDFGRFPPELYQVQYPAPGDPSSRAECKSCSRRCQSSSTIRGDSTTEHGRCFDMCIPMPTFPWCS